MCRTSVPMIEPDQVLVAIVWIMCNIGVLVEHVSLRAHLIDPPQCGDCRYDLRGLERRAACPECGSSADRRACTPARSAWRVRWQLARRLIPACLCLAAAIFLGDYLLAPGRALMLSERYGYAWRTSFPLAFRDVRGIAPHTWTILPFFAAWTPLTAFARSARARWTLCVALVLVPCIIAARTQS